jgi:AsmA protein
MIIMKKIIKTILLIILISAISIGAMIAFFITKTGKETIKNEITQLVYNKTGNKLNINGDLSWSLFPSVSIKINDLVIENILNSQKDKKIKIGEINFGINLLSLFSSHIFIDHLILKDFIMPLDFISIMVNSSENNVIPDNKAKFSLSSFSTISKIDLDNGELFWRDQKTNKIFKINKINFHCKNINLNRPFDIASSFYLQSPISWLNGKIELDTNLKLDIFNKKCILENLQISGKLAETKDVFSYSSNIMIDLQRKILASKNFNFQANDEKITGSIHISNIDSIPDVTAELFVSKLNFAYLMPVLSRGEIETPSNSRVVKSNGIKPKYKVAAKSAPNIWCKIKFTIDLKINFVQIAKLKFNNFMTKIINNNGIINFSKINFSLYDGSASGDAFVDVCTDVPKIDLQLAINNISMQSLLIDINNYNKFNGVLNLRANINTHGPDVKKMLNNLNGGGKFLLSNGVYYGIDIPYEIKSASALLTRKDMPQISSPVRTSFDSLNFGFRISNAVLHTKDLLVQAPDYKVTGQGSVNLLLQKLDLQLSAYSTHDSSFFVPIKIYGNFDNPSIRPDVPVMMAQVIRKELDNQLQKLNIPKELLKVLPLGKLID